MFDNGYQTTLVLNSYAREAKLKKVRGIGPGKLEPNVIYEVSLVKLDGGTMKIQAHGVDHVIREMQELDFAPAKQAFISILESEIEPYHGLVKLLVGMDHLYLHPMEMERTGGLALYISMFGIRTGWVIAGNMEEAARGTAWLGAVRQHPYVPLDFLSAEALGTEPLPEKMRGLHEVQGVPVQGQCAHRMRNMML
jgi:hypothetical protein